MAPTPVIADVTDYPKHFIHLVTRAWSSRRSKLPAHGDLFRPAELGHRLINDRSAASFTDVVPVEITPGQQGNAHRAEKVAFLHAATNTMKFHRLRPAIHVELFRERS